MMCNRLDPSQLPGPHVTSATRRSVLGQSLGMLGGSGDVVTSLRLARQFHCRNGIHMLRSGHGNSFRWGCSIASHVQTTRLRCRHVVFALRDRRRCHWPASSDDLAPWTRCSTRE